ncbi:hypothetical protein IWX49DRAFT_163153 [Phyllosticta citricarpa]|uniref:Secreted protein n=2 Tax=Phyllosticta TaxID=121621 RepID=A0ABR1MPN3_9PEZI
MTEILARLLLTSVSTRMARPTPASSNRGLDHRQIAFGELWSISAVIIREQVKKSMENEFSLHPLCQSGLGVARSRANQLRSIPCLLAVTLYHATGDTALSHSELLACSVRRTRP